MGEDPKKLLRIYKFCLFAVEPNILQLLPL